MNQRIAHVALLVKDYDEAIAFYTQKLGFQLVEDTQLTDTKRWVVVSPPGSNSASLLLARASGEQQAAAIGNQTGGRVFLFLQTDDIRRDYERMRQAQVHFVQAPVQQPYGVVAVFEDLYGNKWDLIQYT